MIVGATVAMVVLGVAVVGLVVLDSGVLAGQPSSVSELDDEEHLPDGITKDGVTDAGAAAQEHRDALSDVSYTLELTAVREVEGASGEPVEVTQQLRNDGDGTILTTIDRRGSAPYSLSIWTNESMAVRQVNRNGETSYSRPDASDIRQGATGSGTIREVLAAGVFEPTEVKDDGEWRVVLTAEEPTTDAAEALGVESVSEFSGTVEIDAEGRVRAMEVEMTFTDTRGNRITQTLTQRVTDVGSTTVERPDWFDEAVAQTGGGRLIPASQRAVA